MVMHHRHAGGRLTAARAAVQHEYRRRLAAICRDLRNDGASLAELQRLSGLKRRELADLIKAIEVLER